jgi:hypothetical protein
MTTNFLGFKRAIFQVTELNPLKLWAVRHTNTGIFINRHQNRRPVEI